MKVEDIMTRKVFYVHSDQSLNDAAQIMWEHNCGSVPVVDYGNQVIGMLTDRDIAMAAYINGERLANISVSTARSKQVIACSPDDELGDVEDLMQTHQVHRLPVISDSFEALGIVSLNDIALAYKSGKRGIKAQEVSDTLAAICQPGAKALSVVGAVA